MEDEKTNNSEIVNTSPRKPSTELPDEIIQEILSRSQIQSLFEHRYVSKLWRILINDNRLSKMHYTQSCRQINTPTSLIINHSSQLHYLPNINEKNTVQLKNLPFKSWLPTFDLIGSRNGFLCVADATCQYRSIFICNPVIGDWFLLPDEILSKNYEPLVLGFGYEPKRNEYKVVSVMIDSGNVKLHTVGSNSWKTIGYVQGIVQDFTGSPGVFVNGNLHWLENMDDYTKVSIIVICLAEECIAYLPVSIEGKTGKLSQGFHLGELDGCLTIVDDSFDDHVNVWVMTEYANPESLRKQYVIPRPPPILACYENRLKPLVLQNDGDILLQVNDGEFFTYNPRTNSLSNRLLHVELDPSGESIRAVTHVGTLLPIKEAIRIEGGMLEYETSRPSE